MHKISQDDLQTIHYVYHMYIEYIFNLIVMIVISIYMYISYDHIYFCKVRNKSANAHNFLMPKQSHE